MFLTQPVALIAYLIVAFLVGNILTVCREIDRTKYDVVMGDMPIRTNFRKTDKVVVG